MSTVGANEDLERLADLGRLSASLLHEISSPLSVALINLDQIGDQSSQNVIGAKRCLFRIVRYVNAARRQLNNPHETSLFYVDYQVNDLKRLIKPIAQEAFVRLKISPVPRIKLRGSHVRFQQILVNLLINAIEAYSASQQFSPERVVSLEMTLNAKNLLIKVSDHGGGIARDNLNKLFDPFYTTKNQEHGLGIGLTLVKRYIKQDFCGSVRVKSSLGKGTCFKLTIPLPR